MTKDQTPQNREDGAPRAGVPRRTVLRGAAWSMPVVAVAAATPARAASGDGNVIVTSSCYGITILGVGASFPQFHITAVGQPVLAGSTFLLSGTGLAGLTFGSATGLFDVQLVGGNQAIVTVGSDIPAGSSSTLQVTGIGGAFLARTYTLSVDTILGNANVITTDDSASQRLSGVSVLGVLVGRCS
ncbi:hypothetical protein [Microbacterium sp.]|uniref:hypothetical protein n=1 Tax=Microbacterium sp. TaxID=51671 RepID=UPI003341302D